MHSTDDLEKCNSLIQNGICLCNSHCNDLLENLTLSQDLEQRIVVEPIRCILWNVSSLVYFCIYYCILNLYLYFLQCVIQQQAGFPGGSGAFHRNKRLLSTDSLCEINRVKTSPPQQFSKCVFDVATRVFQFGKILSIMWNNKEINLKESPNVFLGLGA